ncbi:hypothetical protein FGG08_003270 [Glutinoglossum americanum]|uniref:K Homology domain-containing protein n=1 Tax=Glutinoglossum americanum TaxID=1670608 RepID=A0A9P8I7J9_9PEZI|nr:hypothetical protein FGG08_003270 [Glutinoglossum americanum]
MSLRSCSYRRSQALKSPTIVFQAVLRDPLVFLYPRWFFLEATAHIDTATSVRSIHSHASPETQKTTNRASLGEEERTATGKPAATPPLLPPDNSMATPANVTTLQQHVPLKLDTSSLNIRRVAAVRNSRDKSIARKALNRRSMDKCHPGSWRVALGILDTHSYRLPAEGEHCELRIAVPGEGIGLVIGRFGKTLRHIQEQSGCLIQVIQHRKDDAGFAVQITGTAQAARMAEKHVMAIVNRKPRGLTGYAPVSSARTELELGGDTPKACQVPEYPVFSQVESQIAHRKARFLECVKRLSESPVTHRQNRFLTSRDKLDLGSVAETIHRLFSNLQSRPAITTQSLNEAMKFLGTHNLVPHLRRLFVNSELHHLNMDTSTFNVMLRRAAEAGDLYSFTFLLRLMVKRNLRPDSRTWCTFLSAMDQKEVKGLILKKMEESNLLTDPVVVRDVCRQIISDLAAELLDAHKDIRDLLEYMDGRFTAAWYSASAINRVLDELGKRGMMQEAWDLLEAVDARGFTFNSISVNTILTYCLRYRKADLAVQLFRAAGDRWNISPDGVTYELLFKTSWTSRLYNMARVVWRYACMDGAVSSRMRRLVDRSMRCPVTSPCTIGGRWRATAGRVIAGVNNSRAPGASSSSSTSTGTLSVQSVEDQERVSVLELTGTEMLERDLAAFGLWSPVRPLSVMLSDAYAIDKDWSTDKRAKDYSVVWKLENAIDVPVRLKQQHSGDCRLVSHSKKTARLNA